MKFIFSLLFLIPTLGYSQIAATSIPVRLTCDLRITQTESFNAFQQRLNNFQDINGDGVYAICIANGVRILTSLGNNGSLVVSSNTHIYGPKSGKAYILQDSILSSSVSVLDLTGASNVYLSNLWLRVNSSFAAAVRSVNGNFKFVDLEVQLSEFSSKAILLTAAGVLDFGYKLKIEGKAGSNSGIFMSEGGVLNYLKGFSFKADFSHSHAVLTTSNAQIGTIQDVEVELMGHSSSGFNFGLLTNVNLLKNIQIIAHDYNATGVELSDFSVVDQLNNLKAELFGPISNGVYVNNESLLNKFVGGHIVTHDLSSDGIVYRRFPSTGVVNNLTRDIIVTTFGTGSSAIRLSLEALVGTISNFRLYSQPGANQGAPVFVEDNVILDTLENGDIFVPSDGTSCVEVIEQGQIVNQSGVSCTML